MNRDIARLPAALSLALTLGLAGCSSGDADAPPAQGTDATTATASTSRAAFFRDVTEAAGLDTVQIGGGETVDYIIDSIGAGAAWLDYDNDGDADLYLVQGATSASPREGPPDQLWRNDGDSDGDGIPEFVEVGAAAGLGDTSWGFGAAAADYDGDGDTDLLVTNWGPDRLYRNDGDGTFTDVAPALGLDDAGWSTSAAWADTDRDGDLDLYVTRYVKFDHDLYPARGERPANAAPCVWRAIEVYCGPRNLIPEPDVFYRNVGDRDGDGIVELVEATADAGFSTDEAFYGLAVGFFDADLDGDLDLYVANDSVQNAFFVNDGTGRFQEEAVFSGIAYNEAGAEQAGMGVAVGDVDRDGLLDLAISNFSHDHDTLYHNEGGNFFTDRSYVSGIGSPSWLHLAWGLELFDADLDGDDDLFVARGHVYPQVDGTRLGVNFHQANALFLNDGSGTFAPVDAPDGDGLALVKGSRVVVPHDIDDDGDLDLFVTNLNGRPDLLRNDRGSGHWLQVDLDGDGLNRDGLGARVEVFVDGRRLLREIRTGNSLLGSVLPRAHFGLGDASAIDRVVVHWPDGRTSTVEGVEPDRRITVAVGRD